MSEQVVCIRDDWGHPQLDLKKPVKGQVYTIRDYVHLMPAPGYPDLYFRFEELRNSWLRPDQPDSEPIFRSDWFRRVAKTDISKLVSIANNLKPKLTEEA